MDEPIDVTKLKYVIYARKSTDDPQRQVQSLPSQVKECKEFARSKGLPFKESEIIRESESAKTPGIRPLFTQMLKDIAAGKFDGIIAWNPDRLARNMKEGGEIIDMIDSGVMTDLKFVTHHFTPDANGKMLLGMAFVLSKQYSDKLSQDVTRGLHDKVDLLRSHIQKHGYITDDYGQYYPGGNNYDLMCEAWKMRIQGISIQTISDYLNDNGYFRQYRTSERKGKMDKQRLSVIFKDPFYYGLLIQGTKKVDIRASTTFKPTVTEQEYIQVQNLSTGRIHPVTTRDNFYPFRQFVKCHYCQQSMTVGPNTGGSGKRYLNFRCDTKNCTRTKKSLRVKVLLDYINKFLEEGLNFTEKDYLKYKNDMEGYLEEKQTKISIQLHSKEASLKLIDHEITDISLRVIKLDEKSTIRVVNEKKITQLVGDKARLQKEIESLRTSLPHIDQDQLSLEDFLNLTKNAAIYIKSGNEFVKDSICRLIFSNFTVDEEKVTMYQLKEPFTTLLKGGDVSTMSGCPDSNWGPPRPKRGALPSKPHPELK